MFENDPKNGYLPIVTFIFGRRRRGLAAATPAKCECHSECTTVSCWVWPQEQWNIRYQMSYLKLPKRAGKPPKSYRCRKHTPIAVWYPFYWRFWVVFQIQIQNLFCHNSVCDHEIAINFAPATAAWLSCHVHNNFVMIASLWVWITAAWNFHRTYNAWKKASVK